MTHIEQLHLDAIQKDKEIRKYLCENDLGTSKLEIMVAKKSAKTTKNITIEFAIFFSGVMPMNCKEIMRRLDLPNKEKVKLVFQEYLKTKEK
jgi:hypothetical protein